MVLISYGKIQCLITCHRVSEGIDIKALNTVVLFASNVDQRETIQRIGRALRKKLGVSKTASVVDFIYDNPNSSTNPDIRRKGWLSSLAEERNPT